MQSTWSLMILIQVVNFQLFIHSLIPSILAASWSLYTVKDICCQVLRSPTTFSIFLRTTFHLFSALWKKSLWLDWSPLNWTKIGVIKKTRKEMLKHAPFCKVRWRLSFSSSFHGTWRQKLDFFAYSLLIEPSLCQDQWRLTTTFTIIQNTRVLCAFVLCRKTRSGYWIRNQYSQIHYARVMCIYWLEDVFLYSSCRLYTQSGFTCVSKKTGDMGIVR